MSIVMSIIVVNPQKLIDQNVLVTVNGKSYETKLLHKNEDGGFSIQKIPEITNGMCIEFTYENEIIHANVLRIDSDRAVLMRVDNITSLSA